MTQSKRSVGASFCREFCGEIDSASVPCLLISQLSVFGGREGGREGERERERVVSVHLKHDLKHVSRRHEDVRASWAVL